MNDSWSPVERENLEGNADPEAIAFKHHPRQGSSRTYSPQSARFRNVGESRHRTALTPRMALDMAAPHTWPAAILPTLLAAACAAASTGILSVFMMIVLLLIVVFMQSAANTFNDYYDFVKGTDDVKADVDPHDAVLVYNNVDPNEALRLAIGYLAVPFVLGIYVIARTGPVPLIIAFVGALFVVLYSAGKTPLSYLPLGEVASGFVMGGLIPLACYQALAGQFSWLALVWAAPQIVGVALIMFTNNTCDIERDKAARRSTLPVLLGRGRACVVYRVLVIVMLASIVVVTGVFFPRGLIVAPFMLAASYPIVAALMRTPLDGEHRQQAMAQCLTVNVVLGAFYCAGIFASASCTLAL